MPSRVPHVCWDCRRAKKASKFNPQTCQSCGGEMHALNYRWRIPKHRDVRRWVWMRRVVENTGTVVREEPREGWLAWRWRSSR